MRRCRKSCPQKILGNMAVRKKFLLSFNRLLPDSKLCFRTRLDSTLYVNKREAKKLYNSTQNPTFNYSLRCFSMRYEMYGLCFKPYTKLCIEAFKTLHKYYTRKPIVIHAECAFGAAVAALSRHQVIFSRRPVTPTSRFVTYRGTAVNLPRRDGKLTAARR